MFAALKPEGLRTFRGGLCEVLRAVQALHDLVHVVIAALHRLALQRKLILHVFHHLNRDPLDFNQMPPLKKKRKEKKTNHRRAPMRGAMPRNAIIRQWS